MSAPRAPNLLTTVEKVVSFIIGLPPSQRATAWQLISTDNYAEFQRRIAATNGAEVRDLSNTAKKKLKTRAITELRTLNTRNTLLLGANAPTAVPFSILGGLSLADLPIGDGAPLLPGTTQTPLRAIPIGTAGKLPNATPIDAGTSPATSRTSPLAAASVATASTEGPIETLETEAMSDPTNAPAPAPEQTITIKGVTLPVSHPTAVRYLEQLDADLASTPVAQNRSEPACNGPSAPRVRKPAGVVAVEWVNSVFSPLVLVALAALAVWGFTYIFLGAERAQALELQSNKLVSGRPWFWLVVTGIYTLVLGTLLKVFPKSIGRGVLIILGSLAILGAVVWLAIPTVIPTLPALVILALAAFLVRHVVNFAAFSVHALVAASEAVVFTVVQFATVSALNIVRLAMCPIYLNDHEARYQSLRAKLSVTWGIGWLMEKVDERALATRCRLTHESKVPTTQPLGKSLTRGQWAVAGLSTVAVVTWLWVVPAFVAIAAMPVVVNETQTTIVDPE